MVRKDILRVPIINALGELPTAVKVLDGSLPARLAPDKVATKADIEGLEGLNPDVVNSLIGLMRAQVLAEVQVMLDNAGINGYVFKQDSPVSQAVLKHDFNRDGPVSVTVYAHDYSFVWEFVEVYRIDENTVQIAFGEPTAFNAVVL